MTDKLLCPFCNKPLQPTLRQSDEYWCENYDCPQTNIAWVGSQKLWQELIKLMEENKCTRKALDVAIRGLDQMTWGCDSSDAEHLLKEIKEITAEQKDGR